MAAAPLSTFALLVLCVVRVASGACVTERREWRFPSAVSAVSVVSDVAGDVHFSVLSSADAEEGNSAVVSLEAVGSDGEEAARVADASAVLVDDANRTLSVATRATNSNAIAVSSASSRLLSTSSALAACTIAGAVALVASEAVRPAPRPLARATAAAAVLAAAASTAFASPSSSSSSSCARAGATWTVSLSPKALLAIGARGKEAVNVALSDGRVVCTAETNAALCAHVTSPTPRSPSSCKASHAATATATTFPAVELLSTAFDVVSLSRRKRAVFDLTTYDECRTALNRDLNETHIVPDGVDSFTFNVRSSSSASAYEYDEALDLAVNTSDDVVKSIGGGVSGGVPILKAIVDLSGSLHVAGRRSKATEFALSEAKSARSTFYRTDFVAQTHEFSLRTTNVRLAASFVERIVLLPEAYGDGQAYDAFIRDYGTHFYTSGTLGGRYGFVLAYDTRSLSTTTSTGETASACLQVEANVALGISKFASVGGELQFARCANLSRASSAEGSFTEAARSRHSLVEGGTSAEASNLAAGVSFGTGTAGEKEARAAEMAAAFRAWSASLAKQPVIVTYQLQSLHTLLDPAVLHARHNATLSSAMLDARRENLARGLRAYYETGTALNLTNADCSPCAEPGRAVVAKRAPSDKHAKCLCWCPFIENILDYSAKRTALVDGECSAPGAVVVTYPSSRLRVSVRVPYGALRAPAGYCLALYDSSVRFALERQNGSGDEMLRADAYAYGNTNCSTRTVAGANATRHYWPLHSSDAPCIAFTPPLAPWHFRVADVHSALWRGTYEFNGTVYEDPTFLTATVWLYVDAECTQWVRDAQLVSATWQDACRTVRNDIVDDVVKWHWTASTGTLSVRFYNNVTECLEPKPPKSTFSLPGGAGCVLYDRVFPTQCQQFWRYTGAT